VGIDDRSAHGDAADAAEAAEAADEVNPKY
jgi:hypothetical protein